MKEKKKRIDLIRFFCYNNYKDRRGYYGNT